MLRKLNFNSMLESMGQMMDSMMADMEDLFEMTPGITSWKRTEAGYELRLEVPGFSKEDLKIDVDQQTMTVMVRGQKSEKEDKFARNASFCNSYSLPEYCEHEKLAASVKNGVCLLSVPAVKQENKPRTISVSIS